MTIVFGTLHNHKSVTDTGLILDIGINTLNADVPFLYPLKTSENL